MAGLPFLLGPRLRHFAAFVYSIRNSAEVGSHVSSLEVGIAAIRIRPEWTQMTRVRLRQNAFNRWIVVDGADESKAWSGSRFVPITEDGFPASDVANIKS